MNDCSSYARYFGNDGVDGSPSRNISPRVPVSESSEMMVHKWSIELEDAQNRVCK